MHTQVLGTLQDTERILQVLVNAHFIQSKSAPQQHAQGLPSQMDQTQLQMHKRDHSGGEDDEGAIIDEDQLYDLDDKKVLNKRKKRAPKVEDCNQALE